MLGDRLTVTTDLEVLSPLHIGTGERVDCPGLLSEEDRATGNNEPGPGLAVVVTDHRGWPCIPGPSLKGALRAILRDSGTEAWKRLFGVDRETSAKGSADGLGMGRLLVRTAFVTEAPSETLGQARPHRNLVARGAFASTRTRIDRDSGGVQLRKLFHQEQVMPGLRFRVLLCLLEPNDAARDALAACLKTLGQPDGHPLGKGRSSGAGRVRLALDTLSATRQTLDPETLGLKDTDETEALKARINAATAPSTNGTRRVLSLVADGPYLSRDPQRSGASTGRRDRDDVTEQQREAQIQPLMREADTPDMLGTSLKGVLRSRAAWLEALAMMQAGQDGPSDDPDKIYRAASGDPARDLTATERLFGVNGWRGLLRLETPQVRNPGRRRVIHSVSLDRHSMAPLHGALFETEAFVGPAFTVTLTLERRPGIDDALHERDLEALDRLIDDLAGSDTPPLMVGHGTSKGYGWFKVTRAEEHDDAA